MSSLEILPGYRYQRSQPHFLSPTFPISNSQSIAKLKNEITTSRRWSTRRASGRRSAALTATSTSRFHPVSASLQELDLTEENVKQVLFDAREKFSHIFDTSVGMTGVAELAELDGPFVKISLKGRFWHERSLILARLGNYLKQRIPEILEVDIEDEKQLDDSPENF